VRRGIGAGALALIGSACRPTYDAGTIAPEARLTAEAASDVLEEALRERCPRLLSQGGRDLGSTDVRVNVDGNGFVTSARLEPGFGDRSLDELYAGVAARMKFDPSPESGGRPYAGRLHMGYACTATTAVATVELR